MNPGFFPGYIQPWTQYKIYKLNYSIEETHQNSWAFDIHYCEYSSFICEYWIMVAWSSDPIRFEGSEIAIVIERKPYEITFAGHGDPLGFLCVEESKKCCWLTSIWYRLRASSAKSALFNVFTVRKRAPLFVFFSAFYLHVNVFNMFFIKLKKVGDAWL